MVASPLAGALVVFVVIAGLELVDRTNFSIIALAARQSPLGTFIGGALAFVVTTSLAVTIGAVLVAALGPSRIDLLRIGGGIFLIGYALWLYFATPEEPPPAGTRGSAIWTAFLVTFLLELGDTTMIFQIVFVTTYGWLVVLAAGATALVCVAAVGSTIGRQLGARLERAQLNSLVVAVLLIVGVLTLLYGLEPGWFAAFG